MVNHLQKRLEGGFECSVIDRRGKVEQNSGPAINGHGGDLLGATQHSRLQHQENQGYDREDDTDPVCCRVPNFFDSGVRLFCCFRDLSVHVVVIATNP